MGAAGNGDAENRLLYGVHRRRTASLYAGEVHGGHLRHGMIPFGVAAWKSRGHLAIYDRQFGDGRDNVAFGDECSTTPFQTTREVHRLCGSLRFMPQVPQNTSLAAFSLCGSRPPPETPVLPQKRPRRRPPAPKFSIAVVISPRLFEYDMTRH